MMEGSVAAGADAAEATGTEAPAAEQGAQFDPKVITDALEGFRGDLEQLRQSQQQTVEPEPEADEPEDLSWLDPAQGEFDAEAAQQRINDMVQKAVQPELERAAEERRVRAVNDLVEEFPELEQEETAKNLAHSTGQLAAAAVQDMGLDALGLPPQVVQQIMGKMATSPSLFRAAFMAAKAQEAAAQEEPADGGRAHIEGGSGPRPGGQQDPEDPFGGAPVHRGVLPWR
jgi:hypothetical protein